jgi:hypothetical protein
MNAVHSKRGSLHHAMILGKLEVELRTPPSAGAKFRFARDTDIT